MLGIVITDLEIELKMKKIFDYIIWKIKKLYEIILYK